MVADPGRVGELATALAEPFDGRAVDVAITTGGDDTIDTFEARAPRVVVLTASLELGDTKSLIEALRELAPRDRLAIVLVGDDDGPIRTALDAIELKPDRFVSRPLSVKALRFAVQSGLDTVARMLGEIGGNGAGHGQGNRTGGYPFDVGGTTGGAPTITSPAGGDAPMAPAAAGSSAGTDGEPPVVSRTSTSVSVDGASPAVSRTPTSPQGSGLATSARADASTEEPFMTRAPTDRGIGIATMPPANGPGGDAERAALRARWAALADSISDDELDDEAEPSADDAAPLPPIEIAPRKKGSTNPEFLLGPPVTPWRPGTTSELHEEPELSAPPREPTLILHDDVPPSVAPVPSLASASPPRAVDPPPDRGPRERWSQPVLLSDLIDRNRDSSRELLAHVKDDLGSLDEIDDDLIVGHPASTPPAPAVAGGHLQALEDLIEAEPPPDVPRQSSDAEPPDRGRDFARQLRAKMSKMAQRLFQSDSPVSSSVDVRPRHDHHTEIDLAALGEEPALGGGVTEIESRARAMLEQPQVTTSPGSWDTQVRERGLPDSGELVRGVSDTALVLAKLFAQSFTGRVGFRKDDVEKVVYFDQGRPVFASSNEPGDRMGELLVREGKITASQYERCQVHVAQSGRRIGEILVDFGYLKRRELLPAVRRHVEDIIYSLFGWEHGHYHMTPETTASAERIRLSRHPASLVLEGIRRKLDRTTLEKLLGPSSTVIELPDRERLGGIINAGDLTAEERAALAAFDGHADLAQVARVTGVDVADVLPFAWGLCVLGLASARRTEQDALEESNALVGETDLAIDRERVRARWQLVTEADYFALLGVRRDATAFEIRRAYQSARRDFAADCFPGDLRRELALELEEISSVLDEAFRVLRDDRLRLTYLANLIE